MICLIDSVDDLEDDWVKRVIYKFYGSKVSSSSNQQTFTHRTDKNENSFLKELDKYCHGDEEPDSLEILMEILEPLINDFISQGQDHFLYRIPGSKETSNYPFDQLLIKQLEMCSQKDLPLYLHLLVSQANVNPRVIINPILKTRAIHHASCNGNTSSALYLLSNQASAEDQDVYGRAASHYAYMYGHHTLGDILHTNPNLKTTNGLKPDHMRSRYGHYFSQYIDMKNMALDDPKDVTSGSELTKRHMNALKERWIKHEIGASVEEAKVDYTKGEALEVKNCIKNFLESLVSSVGKCDSLFEAELVLVGSSEDDVRVFTPDEYDCNIVFLNFSGYPGEGCKVTFTPISQSGASHSVGIDVSTDRPELKELFKERNLLNKLFSHIKKCLPNITLLDRRLTLTLPMAKLTLVGVALRFAWHGEQYPLLLIDVDVVPTMRAPCPSDMKNTALIKDIHEIYLNTIGRSEWRCSFAQTENKIMKSLSEDEKRVFLTCKILLSGIKAEGWMSQEIKEHYKFLDQRKMKIPVPKGYMLKNAFFLEKEKVTDPMQWTEEKILDRTIGIFMRMCVRINDTDKYVPGRIKAYFGDNTQEASIGYGAPEILQVLLQWKNERKKTLGIRQENMKKI